MQQLFSRLFHMFAGGIYSDEYEEWSNGGPKCHAQMLNTERVVMNALSASVNIFLFFKLLPRVSRSKELDLSLPKRLTPNALEYLVGGCSLATYIVMAMYKCFTGRGVFLLNPCHWVLLLQSFLLLTKKTRLSGYLYVTYVRWLFGPILALVFPDTIGMDLFLESEFFYIEHYLAAFIGPLTLMFAGRFGFFEGESLKTIAAQQWWGFAIHSLEQRLVNHPISLWTLANLNGILCNIPTDPAFPVLGKYYLYFADHYLNFASLVFATLFIVFKLVVSKTARALAPSPKV